MARVRVLVSGVPEILRAILLRALAAAPDLEVDSRRRTRSLLEAAEEARADIVVTQVSEGGLDAECEELLRRRPRLKILVLRAHGRQAYSLELQPQRVSLGELTPEGLVAAIREMARRPVFLPAAEPV